MRLIGTLATIAICLTTSALIAEDQEVVLLTKQLDSSNVEEKTKAARMLGEIGPAAAPAVPSLIKAVEDKDLGLRHEAIVALGRIASDPKRVVPVLNRLLSDPVPLLRDSVIDALLRFGPEAKEALPQLKQLLKDPEPLINVSAARAIVEIESKKGADVTSVVPVLVNGLKSERPEVSMEAIHGLAVIGQSTVPEIQKLVDGTGSAACCNACDALGAMGPMSASAVDKLLTAAKSTDDRLRWHAIVALGDVGPAAKAAVPILIDALTDKDPPISFSAERSLQKIGKAAVPGLTSKLNDEKLQLHAARVIGEIGPEASDAITPLAELLKSPNAETRREAILALAAIGPDAKSTTPTLIKNLADKKFPYQSSAAFALGRMGSKDAIPALKESLKAQNNAMLHLASIWALLQLDPTNEEYLKDGIPQLTMALDNERPEVRREAAKALGRIGSRAKSAIPALQKKLSDADADVRREALVALAEIGPDSAAAVKDIQQVLDQGDLVLRPIACYALGRIGEPAKPAVPYLRRLMQSNNPHEKTVAAWALVNISPDKETVDQALPLLAAAVTSAANPEVRIEIAGTLGKVGRNSPVAQDALKRAQKDPNESVRQAAEKALKQSK